MIDKLIGIPWWGKALCILALMAVTSAVTFHYTSQSYDKEIGELTEKIANKEAAITIANASIDSLIVAIEDQNKAYEDFAAKRQGERAEAAKKVATLEAAAAKLRGKIADLEKIKRPVVDVAAMSTQQVAEEIGECRRAVEINKAANTGELL